MFTIWRPNLPESNDGEPLAKAIGDLFWNFPYHRLPANHTLVALLMRPEVVLALVVFYWFSKPPLKALVAMMTAAQQHHPVNPNNSNTGNRRSSSSSLSKSRALRFAVAGHNLLLAVYSAITVLYSWPIVIQHLSEYGLYDTYCDPHKTLWHSGFGAWALVFYISKYYEFVDTWILVLKGKEPSFLQVYHHTGIVLTMWAAVASQSAWLTFVVLLNSFIHTLMYTYFLCKTLVPTMHIPSAKYLTTAQIGQFWVGIAGSAGVLILGETCDSASSRFALLGLQFYGFGLIALFVAFAKRKYASISSPTTKKDRKVD